MVPASHLFTVVLLLIYVQFLRSLVPKFLVPLKCSFFLVLDYTIRAEMYSFGTFIK